jgi:hypothetical protein
MKRTVSVAVTTLRFAWVCVSVDTVTVTVTGKKLQEQGCVKCTDTAYLSNCQKPTRQNTL